MLPEPRQLLPPEAYTSAAWFEREQRELFARSWLFACFADDLPAAGDYLCVRAGRASLVVVRDGEGGLRAFHNVCRHRGARLLEGKGNAGGAIRCFYHAWSYGLDGGLASVSLAHGQFPGLDREPLGLRPAAIGQWETMVFVNPEPAAEPFATWLAGAPASMAALRPADAAPHRPGRLIEMGDVSYRVRANWKIVVENFIDGYHLPLLHSVSLADGDFLGQRFDTAGAHITFYRGLKPGVRRDDRAWPVIEGVPATFGAAYIWFFPTIAIFETANSWSTFLVEPVAPDLSRVHCRMFAMPEARALAGNGPPIPDPLPPHVLRAAGPGAGLWIDARGLHPLRSDDVMLEDIYACEAVQAGLESGSGQVGPLSRWEASMTFFQARVLDHVSPAS
jgi:Rieske 2Fe-2S family protein